jgi:hypothetical protein
MKTITLMYFIKRRLKQKIAKKVQLTQNETISWSNILTNAIVSAKA